MPIPGVPTNFYVQQGNSEVLCSWDILSGAISYQLNRSIDGVNYSTIATPSINNYLDTSVSTGTLYYYQVAATNTSGTGSFTNPVSIVPAPVAQMALLQLRNMSLQRADRLGSKFVTVPELNSFINQAVYELYDLLITVYEDYSVADPYVFTTLGTTQFYTLPINFYKMLGVDLGLTTNANARVTIKRFNFSSRNRYIYPQLTSTYLGVFNLRYRVMGNQVMFIPTPSAGQYVTMWYVPRLPQLLQDTDILDGISGWTQYVIVRAAKYILDKEESPTEALDQELLFMKSRIEESASYRDAGENDTVSDVRSLSEDWGGYGNPMGDGSWGGN